ncbi:hypothetical protein G7Y79_00062g093260 [Physcia stellaris]|nr:hypothetical protein G7Y79_00062g093260 [Physcia stellaris]
MDQDLAVMAIFTSNRDFEVVSKHLQRLPSVKSVCFSEEGHISDWFLGRLAETLFKCTRPLTLEIDNVTTILKYDSDGNVKEAGVSCSNHDSTAMSLLDTPQLFWFMFQIGRCASTKLSITGITVHSCECSYFEILDLVDLTLSSVDLASSAAEDSLRNFFSALRHRAFLSTDTPMRVTLTDIGNSGYTGTMNATDDEITAWINGDAESWLAEKQTLFTQCAQELRAEDEGYEDMDMRYWNSSASEDDSVEDWKVLEQRRRKGQMSYFL